MLDSTYFLQLGENNNRLSCFFESLPERGIPGDHGLHWPLQRAGNKKLSGFLEGVLRILVQEGRLVATLWCEWGVMNYEVYDLVCRGLTLCGQGHALS